MATENSINIGVVPGGGFTYTFPSTTSTLYGTGTGTITSAQLAASLTDETGTGVAVFATSPTLVTPLLGTPTSGTLTNCTGLPVGSGISGLGSGVATWLATPTAANLATVVTASSGTAGSLVFNISPTFATDIRASSNTANIGTTTTGWAHLYMTSGGILDFANGDYTLTHATGVLTANKDFRITTAGTNAASVPTLQSTSTLTNKTLTAPAMTTVAETGIGTADLLAANQNVITVSGNAGSASQSFLLNKFVNSSAGTMAITIPVATPTPKDGQFIEVRIYDFSAVTQTIAWVGTENSTVSAPTTSNGSTTLPLSVLFQFNNGTSKWRCIAVA